MNAPRDRLLHSPSADPAEPGPEYTPPDRGDDDVPAEPPQPYREPGHEPPGHPPPEPPVPPPHAGARVPRAHRTRPHPCTQ